MKILLNLFISIFLCSLLLGQSSLTAEIQPVKDETIFPKISSSVILNKEEINKLLVKIESDEKIPSEIKSNFKETANKIIENIKTAESFEKKVQEWETFRNTSPELLESIKGELAKESISLTPETKTLSTGQMDSALLQIKSDLTAIETRNNDVENNLKTLPERRKDIPGILSEAKSRLDKIKSQPVDTSTADFPERIILNQLLSESLSKIEESRIKSLETEMMLYDVQLEVLKKRRERNNKRISESKKLISIWEKLISERRKKEAEEDNKKAREAIRNTIATHQVIKKLALENSTMTQLRIGEKGLASKIEELDKEIKTKTSQHKKITEDYKSIQEKIKASGLTNAIGVFLRLKRSELPNIKNIKRNMDKRKEITGNVQVQILELDEKLKNLSNLNTVSTNLKNQIDSETSKEHRETFYSMIDELLPKQKEYAEALYNDYNTYFIKLIELDTVCDSLIKETIIFRNFIDERVLWIKSNDFYSPRKFFESIKQLTYFVSPATWAVVIQNAWKESKSSPFLWTLVILLMLVLYKAKVTLIIKCNQISELVSKATTDKLIYTIEAIFLSLILSLRRPLILFFISQLLKDTEGFSKSVSTALLSTSLLYFIFLVLRNILVSGGIAELHFRWKPSKICDTIHCHFSKMIMFLLPLYFIWNLLSIHGNELVYDTALRFIFIIGATVYSIIFHRFLQPSGNCFALIYQDNPQNSIYKARYFFYSVFVIIPVILIPLSILGFFYTSQRILQSLNQTFLILCFIFILYSFLDRARRVLKNYLAIRTAEQKKEKSSQNTDSSGTETVFSPTSASFQPSIYVIGEQARTLLTILCVIIFISGMFIVWKDIFPALRIVSNVELWTTTITDVQTNTAPDGSIIKTPVEKIVSINLFDLFKSISVVIVTILATMNLSGFLEFTFFPLVKLESGVKFAVRTILKYIITIIGIIYAFGIIGLSWGKVQWLLTALTVGLGFGLQEIFANFISGLIILFEMPIRVGDTVTIGDVSGTVTKIQIRGTTITNWDKKEIIIPNKEFITGKVINWTLSDSILRVVFNIGVAYGSDVQKVLRLLDEIAQNHVKVLKDPAPIILFSKFGDSSLDFELRVYIPNMDGYATFLTDINCAIDKSFRENNVEIPFPQRDLHLRSVDEKITASIFAPVKISG